MAVVRRPISRANTINIGTMTLVEPAEMPAMSPKIIIDQPRCPATQGIWKLPSQSLPRYRKMSAASRSLNGAGSLTTINDVPTTLPISAYTA